MVPENEEENYKIVIAGLDNAGKTSIVNILNRDYNLMDSIKPTVGMSRSIINICGVPIINFDLGGQARYREGYLTDPTYFTNTDTLFFVVDAVQESRHEEAMYYYKKILKIFERFGIKPKIVICIHKLDPNIRQTPKSEQLMNDITKLFKENSEGYDPDFYVTSIYDRKSIVVAFSKNLQALIASLKPFKQILKSLVHLLKLDGAIIFDENLMILSDFYQNEEVERIFLETIYNSVFYMRSNPFLAQNFSMNFEMILEVKSDQMKRFNFVEVKYKVWDLQLLTMGNEKLYSKKLQERINVLLKDLEKSQ